MFDTTVMLKPREPMAAGHDLRATDRGDGREAAIFPGFPTRWTMPVENRLDMELTGIKTPVGTEDSGPDLGEIQQIGSQIEEILGAVPGTRRVFAERVSQGFYINVEVDRAVAARYGLTVADVQRAVSSAIGGENIATDRQGRERYPINVRYLADYRDDLDALRSSTDHDADGRADSARRGRDVSPEHGAIDDTRRGRRADRLRLCRPRRLRTTAATCAARSACSTRSCICPPDIRCSGRASTRFQLRARKRLTVILPVVFGVDLRAALHALPARCRSRSC